MSPTDKIRLPFRWVFAPEREAQGGAIRWRWRAFSQSDQLAMESASSFESLTECIQDAKAKGYDSP